MRVITFVAILIFSGAEIGNAQSLDVPHWDLEMTGEEYREIFRNNPELLSKNDDPALDKILKLGARGLDWLKHVNSNRPAEKMLSLSSAATQQGFPIEQAGLSNPGIIKQKLADFEAEAPDWFLSVVFKNAPFTDAPPTTDEEFIEWGLKFNRIYQKASRWILQEPWLIAYESRRSGDVRGYYYLQKIGDLEGVLAQWSSLSVERQNEIGVWMAGICFNTQSSLSGCKQEWQSASRSKELMMQYYNKYLAGARKTWNDYFKLGGKRYDVEWNAANPDLTTVPFKNPNSFEVKAFLIDNIEDEWRFGSWALKLDFAAASNAIHIVFKAGATPNVNGLGGNTITMDANQPLSEYNVQWTIRHEYGHTLGLPDCYVEFYEAETSTMVNYQLDVTNLMCSRQGHINQLHHDELKSAYFK